MLLELVLCGFAEVGCLSMESAVILEHSKTTEHDKINAILRNLFVVYSYGVRDDTAKTEDIPITKVPGAIGRVVLVLQIAWTWFLVLTGSEHGTWITLWKKQRR